MNKWKLILIGLFIAVASLYVVVLLLLLFWSEPADTMGEEILKDLASKLLQLAVIVMAGALFKFLLDDHQAREKQLQAEVTLEQEKREALNNLRRQLLRRLVEANHRVRKARILIPAHGSAEVYDEQMKELIDAQLEFSEIEHDIKNIPEILQEPGTTFSEHLQKAREYLGKLTREYRNRYPELSHLAEKDKEFAKQLDKLPVYSAFIKEAHEGKLPPGELKDVYLQNYWEVLNRLREQIRQALSEEIT